MERILVSKLRENIGKKVVVMGHVVRVRDHNKVIFIDLRDRSGEVQCVATSDFNSFDLIKNLKRESVIQLSGTTKERPKDSINDSQNGDIEFSIENIEVLSEAMELPFDMDAELNIDTLLDYRPLTLRQKKYKDIFILQAKILNAYRSFFDKNDFVEVKVPKIVGEDAEGGAEVFKLDYFGNDAYLATSPQLYKQILVGVYERVYTIGNAFRAEKHSTSRHLNEYVSLDAEMGFIKDHRDVMKILEQGLREIIESVKNETKEKVLLPPKEFPSMKLKEAQKILKDNYSMDCIGNPDLDPECERKISEYAKEKLGSDFVFITHYPTSKMPVYTYEDENDKGFTNSFDLLLRGIEVATGGQRIHLYEELIKSFKNKGLDENKFSFYLQAFKYGMPAHGGFGIGIERLTAKLAGIKNIKEASIFPRDINRIDSRINE